MLSARVFSVPSCQESHFSVPPVRHVWGDTAATAIAIQNRRGQWLWNHDITFLKLKHPAIACMAAILYSLRPLKQGQLTHFSLKTMDNDKFGQTLAGAGPAMMSGCHQQSCNDSFILQKSMRSDERQSETWRLTVT